MQIENGAGNGTRAKVDGNNRLHTAAIIESEADHATEVGDGYNINTGVIGLTSSTESGVLLIENNEDSDLVIDFIVIGVDSLGTTSGMTRWTVVKNPTALSSSGAVTINENRNFGSSKTLSATISQGVEGSSFTNGTDALFGFAAVGARTEFRIAQDLPQGSSMGVKVDTQTTAGTTDIYVAVICHVKDVNNKD
jgi:hypothetical protein